MALESVVLGVLVVSEAIVLAFMVGRKLWRTLPTFCAYVAWGMVSDCILYALNSRPKLYFDFFLVQVSVDSLLQFMVLVELVWSVLRPLKSSLPKKTPLILALLLALSGAAIWPLSALAAPTSLDSNDSRLLHLQVTFAILRVVCFLIMASFSQLLAIGWKDRELQVATGLGFYSIISLIVAVLHSHPATKEQYHWLDLCTSLSYLGTLSYWVLSFSTKEQERKEFSPQMQQLLLLMSGGVRAGRSALSDPPSKHTRKKD